LQCVAVCCSVLQCVAVCCSVLQCVAVCCRVLQITTEPADFLETFHDVLENLFYPIQKCIRMDLKLWRILMCCVAGGSPELKDLTFAGIPPQSGDFISRKSCSMCCRVLQCVAVCCSVLQCVAVCCSGCDFCWHSSTIGRF